MIKKINYKLVLYFLVAVFFGISLVPKEIQNDTFTSITLGKNILQNGYILNESLTYHTDFIFYNCRWLFDITTATIYNNFGFFGIHFFVLTISAIISILLFGIAYKYTKKPKLCLLFLFFSLYYVRYGITCRAQIISYIIFILQYYCSKELLKTNKKRYYFILLSLPIILVNFHGTILLTFYIFYLPFIAEFILKKFTKIGSLFKGLEIENSEYYKNLIIIIVISFLEGFISPNSFFPYMMIFQAPIRFYSKYINELHYINFGYIPIVIIYFTIYIMNIKKYKAHDSFMLLGMGIMGLTHIRCLIHFILIGYIIIIDTLSKIIDSSEYEFIEKIKNKNIIINTTLILLLCVCGLLFYGNCNDNYISNDYPVQATKFIQNNIDFSKETLFNDYNIGSYLEFNGIKTFLDSRSEVFVKPFNNTTILFDYFEAYNSNSNYKEFFKKYNFTIALIDKNSDLYNNIQLDNNNNLIVLYEDNKFIIYRIK